VGEGPKNGQEEDRSAEERANEDEQVVVRRAKLARLRESANPFPNDFKRDAFCGDLIREYADADAETLDKREKVDTLAGRVKAIRSFGKTLFLVLEDGTGRLQLYIRKDDVDADVFETAGAVDVGDVVGARGKLFRTRTGELTLRCDSLRLLAKSVRPLPEKWHGLTDVETRYRRRYLDLIVNEDVRQVFRLRARIVAGMRRFMQERGYLEVETPMMQPIAGGAAARPFVTHHNALNLDLCLRIAPELYLKRLVVGGFERVFEINRCFRNEGISTEHNPEFTMCEFYQAYARYEDLMALTEELFAELARELHGEPRCAFDGQMIDYTPPFARMTMAEAVAAHSSLSATEAEDPKALVAFADRLKLDPAKRKPGLGLLADIFEEVVESKLVQPTFITRFPVEISPLARANETDPAFVDRFELFVAGREIANGFSELNDPDEQRARFTGQLELRAAGDEEAHQMDEDYIRALEYGLPPTAGEGIGIDRLTMLLTGSTSIRDVILFPQLKPERGS